MESIMKNLQLEKDNIKPSTPTIEKVSTFIIMEGNINNHFD